MQTVTHRLRTYKEVLDKSKLIQQAGGVVVSIKSPLNAFDDRKKGVDIIYTLITKVPISVAIRKI